MLSTQMWCLRPLTFLPLSKPLGPPWGVVLTDGLSAALERGLGSRPAWRRTFCRSASWIFSQVPSRRQRRDQVWTVQRGWEVVGQKPPRAAPADQGEDCAQDRPQAHRRAAHLLWFGEEGLQHT